MLCKDLGWLLSCNFCSWFILLSVSMKWAPHAHFIWLNEKKLGCKSVLPWLIDDLMLDFGWKFAGHSLCTWAWEHFVSEAPNVTEHHLGLAASSFPDWWMFSIHMWAAFTKNAVTIQCPSDGISICHNFALYQVQHTGCWERAWVYTDWGQLIL